MGRGWGKGALPCLLCYGDRGRGAEEQRRKEIKMFLI